MDPVADGDDRSASCHELSGHGQINGDDTVDVNGPEHKISPHQFSKPNEKSFRWLIQNFTPSWVHNVVFPHMYCMDN